MSCPTLAVRTVALGLALGILGTILTFQCQIGLGFTLFELVQGDKLWCGVIPLKPRKILSTQV